MEFIVVKQFQSFQLVTEYPARQIDVFHFNNLFWNNFAFGFYIRGWNQRRNDDAKLGFMFNECSSFLIWNPGKHRCDRNKVLKSSIFLSGLKKIKKSYATSIVSGSTNGAVVVLLPLYLDVFTFSAAQTLQRNSLVSNVLSRPSCREGLMSLYFTCLCLKMSHCGCNETPH